MSPNSVVISDARRPDMPIVFVNSAFEKLTGYSSNEVFGRNCRFLQGADRNQEGCLVIREALRRREPCETTLRNYRKDGSLFHNRITIGPLLDGKGLVSHFAAFQIDVSAQKRAEDRVRESQARYRSLVENARDAIFAIAPNGTFTSMNPASEAIWSVPRGLENHSLRWFIPTICRSRVKCNVLFCGANRRLFLNCAAIPA